jgi:uncharacterized protein (DUF305 family)
MRRTRLVLLAAFLALAMVAPEPAAAQSAFDVQPGDSAATRAIKESLARTLQGLEHSIHQFTAEPDKDLASAVIAYHLGAIDLAKVVMQYNASGEIREAAEAILALSQKEIARLKDWITHQH